MESLKCIVCIHDLEEGFRKRFPDHIEESQDMCLNIQEVKEAVTITKGFAVCRKHIHRISGCYAFY